MEPNFQNIENSLNEQNLNSLTKNLKMCSLLLAELDYLMLADREIKIFRISHLAEEGFVNDIFEKLGGKESENSKFIQNFPEPELILSEDFHNSKITCLKFFPGVKSGILISGDMRGNVIIWKSIKKYSSTEAKNLKCRFEVDHTFKIGHKNQIASIEHFNITGVSQKNCLLIGNTVGQIFEVDLSRHHSLFNLGYNIKVPTSKENRICY